MAKPRAWTGDFGPAFGVGAYRYALAPYAWVTFSRGGQSVSRWQHPASIVGAVDLRPLPAQAAAGGTPQGVSFVASLQPVTGIELVRSLHMSDEPSTTLMRDAWETGVGFRPSGATLTDLLFDQLTTGADPDGLDGPLPLMPTIESMLEVSLGGHSVVKRERFRWGVHPHTGKVQDRLQRDFRHLWIALDGDPHCQRVLDFWCQQYGVDDWRAFVPGPLRPHVTGRLPHHTTITDTFNRGDSTGTLTASGEGWSWTVLSGVGNIFTNQTMGTSGDMHARADSDLASADHSSQAAAGASYLNSAANYVGVLCRKDATATVTYYRWGNFATDGGWELVKFVGGTETALDTAYTTDPAVADTFLVQASGSTISADHPAATQRASVTDTAIPGNVRAGIFSGGGGNNHHLDSFVAADLAAAATFEQEGYRWRADDGSETTATWLAAQDTTITRPTGQNTRLRVLVDTATNDPVTSAMQLEYKEDSEGAGLWRAVGSSALGAMPAYSGTGQAAAVVNATITTAVTPAKPSTVNAGDLLILQVLHRNDNNDGAGPATITDWTAFAGNPYGGTNNSRQSLYWRIAGAGEASQTVSVTCTGGTTNDLVMARIYRFTAANGFAAVPIEDVQTNAGTASPLTAPATVTPGGLNRRTVCFGAIASSDATIGSMTGETAGDWVEAVTGNTTTGGDGTLNVQTADASAGTAIQGGSIAFTTSTSAHWNTVGCSLVPSGHAIILAASANITAGGEATTAQLTAPASGSFAAGRMQDDENPADTIDLATNDYSEWEWCLTATAVAQVNDIYQFRVTRAGTVLDTYTVTPEWTIGTAGAPSGPAVGSLSLVGVGR